MKSEDGKDRYYAADFCSETIYYGCPYKDTDEIFEGYFVFDQHDKWPRRGPYTTIDEADDEAKYLNNSVSRRYLFDHFFD